MPQPNRHVMHELHVFVSVDPEGNEGIIAPSGPTGFTPMVASQDSVVAAFVTSAGEIADAMAADPGFAGWSVRHLRFTTREVVTDDPTST